MPYKTEQELEDRVQLKSGFASTELIYVADAKSIVTEAYKEGYTDAIADLEYISKNIKTDIEISPEDIESLRWKATALTVIARLDTKYSAKVYTNYEGDTYSGICYYVDQPYGFQQGFKTLKEAKDATWAKLLKWKEEREKR